MQNYSTLIMIALLIFFFYFAILRPQKKRQQAIQKTMNELGPGTPVMLTSGVFGTVVGVTDTQAVVEIAPGVDITVLKQAIAKIVEPEPEAALDDDDEVGEPIDPAPLVDPDPTTRPLGDIGPDRKPS